eukprot:361813_1
MNSNVLFQTFRFIQQKMALQQTELTGENDENDLSNIDINTWLSQNRLGKFKQYFTENEVIMNDLLTYTENTLESIIKDIKQNSNISLGSVYIQRFKDSIRQLQHKYNKPNTSQNDLHKVYRIVMSPKENQFIQKLEDKLSTLDMALKNNLNTTTESITNTKNIENNIISVFNNYQKQLAQRQKLLITKLNQKSNDQLHTLQNQKNILENYKQSVKASIHEQNAMILNPNLNSSKREIKMEVLTNNTLNSINNNDLNVTAAQISFIMDNNVVNKCISSIGDVILGPEPPIISVSDIGVDTAKITIDCNIEEDVIYGIKYKQNGCDNDDEKKECWIEMEIKYKEFVCNDLITNKKYTVCARFKILDGNIWSGYSNVISFKTMKQIDKWDIGQSGDYAVFDMDAICVSNKDNAHWYAAFGSIGVNKGIHEWILKIKEIGNTDNHFLAVGVVTKTMHKNTWCYNKDNDAKTNYQNYAFACWNSQNKGCVFDQKRSYNRNNNALYGYVDDFRWNVGDNIVMTLDLINNTLKYVINGRREFLISDIYNDFNDNYRLAVNNFEYNGKTKIEFVSYNQLS